MANKKNTAQTNKATEKYRSRVFMLMLYPDCAQHVEVMDNVSKSYDFAAILHDKDTWTAEDEAKDPKHVAGELKKPHWHVIVRASNNAVWSTAFCDSIGLDDARFCEKVSNFDNSLEYLMHRNNPEKAQYTIDEVFGNLKTRLNEIIVKGEKTEGEKVVELIEYIINYDGRLKVTDFAKHCATNGYWAEFRRSGAIFCKMIDEHNQTIDNVSRETI